MKSIEVSHFGPYSTTEMHEAESLKMRHFQFQVS